MDSGGDGLASRAGLAPASASTEGAPRPRPFLVTGSDPKDLPGPRCGHSLTALASAPDRKPDVLVLFGGATALETNGEQQPGAERSAPASPSATSSSGIRLAGATSDVHIMRVATGEWERLAPVGEPPSPRAAHAAAAVGHMVVVQGGIGPAGLATEDLHVLDFSHAAQPRWHRVVVAGAGPGARYAHTIALVAQRFLVAIGGNDGKQALSDAWALDTAEKPYRWRKIAPEPAPGAGPAPAGPERDAEVIGDLPSARMYATSCTRQDGLLLLMGGRDASATPLSDAYGLVRHRDGRWEWTTAPSGSPVCPRYQHAAVFVNGRVHVIGGALGGNKLVSPADATAVLDTGSGVWHRMADADVHAAGDTLRRCRHACAAVGPLVFVFGGLRGGVLLDDMLVAHDTSAAGASDALEAFVEVSARAWATYLSQGARGDASTTGLIEAAEAEAQAALRMPGPGTGAHGQTGQGLGPAMPEPAMPLPALECVDEDESDLDKAMTPGPDHSGGSLTSGMAGIPPKHPSSVKAGRGGSLFQQGTPASDVRLHHRAVVVAADTESEGALGGLVRQLSIDQFENEGRRVSGGSVDFYGGHTPLSTKPPFQGIHKKVLQELLKPRTWKPPTDRAFCLRASEIVDLCDAAEAIFMEEPTVLELQAPLKIYGDLHGQYGDLMRLFKEFGTPMTAGDITYIDYLFLGDYVDRGAHSLETICLLLALKIEYRNHVHLIRGNHEAADINALFGFRLECVERLGDNGGIWIWQRMNALFNSMPLGATIENKILCMHGGIGRSIHSIKDIADIQRPISMEQGGPILMDLLWSDPTTNDSVEGVQPSPRGPGLVTFGPDRVKAFCQKNNIQMIIRAHECVMDGFERFAGGQLITLFSATNYCGTANNAGAILVVGRDLVLVPKLIHPVPPMESSQRVSFQEYIQGDDGLSLGEYLADGTPAGRVYGSSNPDTWMQSINNDRPPTPPRGRPSGKGGSNGTSLAYW